ncbi:hypothetical protein SAMN06297144_2865 [Sphingomonas guangdongensis]|uniref:Uncharacterized protein n=1 Tax=Sphingomonas guangdongensis TaxID=1141890 RepID=A0A285R1Y7_9SPHN|nr:hypothetical protein [Sphingomonas guangdongensis]SOB87729.1 hypothetical protein SAMN06297144_2865 [Sphingomonas guangdongensis]
MTARRRRTRASAVELDATLRRVALALLTLAGVTASGAGLARWALSDVDAYRANLAARTERQPLYARDQPVADQFWARQQGSVYTMEGPRPVD